MLLYIHGFNSSPQSYKASSLKKWLRTSDPSIMYDAPYLRPYPAEAIAQLEKIIEDCLAKKNAVGLIGSSLGGYYAAWLAEKYHLRAVLVNPAVRPFELLSGYIGENKNYHNDDHYTFEQKHVDELKVFYVSEHSAPENLLLMVQTGDKTLDFKEAATKYSACQNIIEYGGDHGFQGFERWFDYLLAFLQANPDQIA